MMAKEMLQWGILSTAQINREIIPVIREEPRSDLLAVASRSEDRARKYADEWNIPRSYGRYEDLLVDQDIDVVYISVPNKLHHQWVVASARAGKHILCEKPLAMSVTECEQMIEIAGRKDVFLQEALMYRYHPQTLRLQKLLMQGLLGDLKYIHAVISYPVGYPHDASVVPEQDSRLNWSIMGGSLWDIGYYAVNFTRMVTNCEPYEVRGWSNKVRGHDADDAFYGTLLFANDVIAHIECGFSQPARFHGEVVGMDGVIFLPCAYGFQQDRVLSPIYRSKDGDEVIEITAANPYFKEVNHFCDCVLENKERIVPLDDALNTIKVVAALYESALTKTSTCI